MYRLLLTAVALAATTIAVAPAWASYARKPINLAVNIAHPRQHVFYVTEKIPVTPGSLTLYYPKYIPGEHGPAGPIVNLTGLVMHANNKTLTWHRDPVDMDAFHINIPKDVNTLTINFDFLSPVAGGVIAEGISMTPNIVDLEWNEVALYPAGIPTAKIVFWTRITLPRGWRYGTALATKSNSNGTHVFEPVTFNNLVDSPLIAGKYFKQINLAPESAVHRYLDMVSDYNDALNIGKKYTEEYSNLIVQAKRLFDSHHYKNYHFLLTLSDYIDHFGLEHHQSSDDRVNADLFSNKRTMLVEASLLPHEYTHSWNGKFRRPAQLWQPNFQIPEHTRMLWVYEGLTTYWGQVLAARSGLWTAADYRAMIAYNSAIRAHRPGRAWRSMIDTTVSSPLLYGSPRFYANWRRSRVDFHNEAAFIWFDVDIKIRELTHDKHSLDDFAKLFFSMDNGSYKTKTYTFGDIVKALNAIARYRWSSYLRQRLETTSGHVPLDDIIGSGWQLVYSAKSNPFEQARETIRKYTDAMFSIGLTVSKNGDIYDVLWQGPAFRAGLAPGMKILGVNGTTFNSATLKRAIAATAGSSINDVSLTVSDQGTIKRFTIRYSGGLRYPHLVRKSGTPDYLMQIITPTSG